MVKNYGVFSYKTEANQHKLEKFLKEFLVFDKDISVNSPTPWQPPTDVYETPNEIIVKMSISGTKTEDIEVAFSGEVLTVSGVRNDTSSHTKTCFYQVEIPYGYFERSIPIPKPIDVGAIQATYKDGFLQIVLPKTESAKPKMFSIKIKF